VRGLPNGAVPTLTVTLIDSDNSNAPMVWQRMGSPAYLSAAQVNALKDASQLITRPFTNWTRSGNNAIVFNTNIQGNSLTMITVRW
jgi:hypothetical protein